MLDFLGSALKSVDNFADDKCFQKVASVLLIGYGLSKASAMAADWLGNYMASTPVENPPPQPTPRITSARPRNAWLRGSC